MSPTAITVTVWPVRGVWGCEGGGGFGLELGGGVEPLPPPGGGGVGLVGVDEPPPQATANASARPTRAVLGEETDTELEVPPYGIPER